MSSTPSPLRSRPWRWLRLALAVLALVASQASVVRAALGASCARAASGPALATVAPASTAQGTTAPGEDVETPREVPVPPAPAPQCAPSAATLPPRVDVAAAVIAWDASPPEVAPAVRPANHAPPPPFHPPRAV